MCSRSCSGIIRSLFRPSCRKMSCMFSRSKKGAYRVAAALTSVVEAHSTRCYEKSVITDLSRRKKAGYRKTITGQAWESTLKVSKFYRLLSRRSLPLREPTRPAVWLQPVSLKSLRMGDGREGSRQSQQLMLRLSES